MVAERGAWRYIKRFIHSISDTEDNMKTFIFNCNKIKYIALGNLKIAKVYWIFRWASLQIIDQDVHWKDSFVTGFRWFEVRIACGSLKLSCASRRKSPVEFIFTLTVHKRDPLYESQIPLIMSKVRIYTLCWWKGE